MGSLVARTQSTVNRVFAFGTEDIHMSDNGNKQIVGNLFFVCNSTLRLTTKAGAKLYAWDGFLKQRKEVTSQRKDKLSDA